MELCVDIYCEQTERQTSISLGLNFEFVCDTFTIICYDIY